MYCRRGGGAWRCLPKVQAATFAAQIFDRKFIFGNADDTSFKKKICRTDSIVYCSHVVLDLTVQFVATLNFMSLFYGKAHFEGDGE